MSLRKKIHHKRLLIGALVCLLPMYCQALSSDQYQSYHISARSMNYNHKSRTITYLGNVHITQGTTTLTGDKVIMYQSPNSNKITKVVVYGNLAHYSTLPDQKKKKLFAKAKQIYYHPQKKTVLLLGKGRVTQNNNVFTGPHIWYDMDHEVVRSTTQSPQQRTVVIIQPQQRNKQNANA